MRTTQTQASNPSERERGGERARGQESTFLFNSWNDGLIDGEEYRGSVFNKIFHE